MKILLFFAALLLFACGGRRTAEQDVAGAVFELSADVLAARADTLIDLGAMSEGETILYRARVRNTGAEPLVITDVASSCGCTDVDYEKRPVAPGADGALEFRFDSRGMAGTQLKLVEVDTSAGKYRITVKAEVN